METEDIRLKVCQSPRGTRDDGSRWAQRSDGRKGFRHGSMGCRTKHPTTPNPPFPGYNYPGYNSLRLLLWQNASRT